MSSLWKKLFIIASVVLVISLVFGITWRQQLKSTSTQLADKTAQLEAAETRLDRIKGEGSWLVDHYPDLKKQISIRLGEGQDGQRFITPDDPAVSAKVQEITGGYAEDTKERWADYERLYSWVVINIEYTLDTYTPILPEPMNETLKWQEGFWRTPAETIRDEAGDCEDLAVLLVSMLLNYNEGRLIVWIIGIESSAPEPSRHIALAFPVENNQLTVLDPTAQYYTIFPIGWGLAADDVSVAVHDWLSRWEEKMNDAQVYMAFSQDVYQEFSSTEEFIEWVNNLEL